MIDDKLYREIVGNVPICCVDLIVHLNGRYLLALRTNEPEKGKWWLPGGRMLKGETFEEAALRIARKELSLDVEFERVVGVYNYMCDKSAFPGVSSHSINVYVRVRPKGPTLDAIKLDAQHKMWYAADRIPEHTHEYLQVAIMNSGVLG